MLKIYFPNPNPWPLPVADWPSGPLEAEPCPVAMPIPPFWALAIPVPKAETPPGPAWADPSPEPLPLAAGLKKAGNPNPKGAKLASEANGLTTQED